MKKKLIAVIAIPILLLSMNSSGDVKDCIPPIKGPDEQVGQNGISRKTRIKIEQPPLVMPGGNVGQKTLGKGQVKIASTFSEVKRTLAKSKRIREKKLLLLKRSTVTVDVGERLAMKFPAPEDIEVLHTIPTSVGQLEAIHGVDGARRNVTEYVSNLKRRMESFESKEVVSLTRIRNKRIAQNAKISQQIVKTIDGKSTDDLTIIIGHVEKGALKFEDGSSLLIADVQKLAMNGENGQIWILGCNTINYVEVGTRPIIATGKKTTYQEALLILETVMRKTKPEERVTYFEVLQAIQKNRRISSVVGLVGFLLVIQMIDDDCEVSGC